MAIAFDASTASWQSVNPGTSVSNSITIGSGSDRVLFALTFTDAITPTVTYGGVGMTKIKQILIGARYLTLWGLLNPATGTANLVASSASGLLQIAGVAYSGMIQNLTPDAEGTATVASDTSITVSCTTVAGNCWLIGGCRFSGATIGAGTGTTKRNNDTFKGMFDSNGPKAPAGSYSLVMTKAGGAGSADALIVSYAPAPQTSTLTETATLVDTIIKAPSRVLSEVVTLVDTLVKQGQKVLTEAITLADTVLKQAGRTLSETMTFADSIVRSIGRTLTEVVKIMCPNLLTNSSFEYTAAGNGTTPAGWTAYNSSGTTTYKGNSTENPATGNQSFKISASSNVDTGIKQRVFLTAGQTLTLSARVRTDASVANANITVADDFGGGGGTTTNVTANQNGRFSVSKVVPVTGEVTVFLGLGSFGASSSGSVWFDDVQLEVGAETTYCAGNITLFTGKVLSDVVALVDTKLFSLARTLSEVTTLVDSVIKTVGRTLGEVVTLTDTLIRTVSRTLTEVVTLVDTFIRSTYKTFTETLSLTDILTTVYSGVARIGNIILRTKKEPKSTLPTNKKD